LKQKLKYLQLESTWNNSVLTSIGCVSWLASNPADHLLQLHMAMPGMSN
jgi:hypothetical protein